MGALQGVLEWLPLSSEGYTIMAASALGISAPAALEMSMWLHVGTLLSALAYFHRELVDRGRLSFLFLATAASGITGFPAYLLAKRFVLMEGSFVTLLIGLLLVLTGAAHRLDFKLAKTNAAIFAGLVQGLAIIPGISRSASTVLALTLSGVEKEEALRLSFLMSIPAVAALMLARVTLLGASPPPWAGIAAAAIVGYFSLQALLSLVRRVDFSFFCVSFGLLAIFSALA